VSWRTEMATRVAEVDPSDAAVRRFIGGRTFILLLIAMLTFVSNLPMTTMALVVAICFLVALALLRPTALRFWPRAACRFWLVFRQMSKWLWRQITALIYHPAGRLVQRLVQCIKNRKQNTTPNQN
jgi:hypothetical protein